MKKKLVFLTIIFVNSHGTNICISHYIAHTFIYSVSCLTVIVYVTGIILHLEWHKDCQKFVRAGRHLSILN